MNFSPVMYLVGKRKVIQLRPKYLISRERPMQNTTSAALLFSATLLLFTFLAGCDNSNSAKNNHGKIINYEDLVLQQEKTKGALTQVQEELIVEGVELTDIKINQYSNNENYFNVGEIEYLDSTLHAMEEEDPLFATYELLSMPLK